MKRLLIVICVLSVLGAAGLAQAQVDRATVSGEVRDAQGGALAGASVAVTSIATNVATRVKTTGDGIYQAVNLAPGQYLIEAEATGFQKSTQKVILEVGQRARVDFALGLGGVTETVEVDARRLLNTEQATLGTNIDQTSVAKLPLAIRNWDDLLALSAGVQGDRYSEEGAATSRGRTGGVNVHGNRSLQNNFLLDGVDNNSISENVQELSTQVSRPSVDAIQEFKLVTSPYSAEYGRAPGAAVSVSTKSGTNQIRGTAYDYYRNDRFDTNTFINKRAKQPKPANDQNQFGGNVGGPIIRDKAFFFVDYEGTRITRGVSRITRVPTAEERQGIFGFAVRDPLTGQNFPNNTIPANRIDPTAAALLALLPPPNQAGANNFFSQPNITDDSNRILGKVDLKLSSTDNVFARYIYSKRSRFVPGHFGGLVDGTSSSSGGRGTILGQGLVAGWTKIISASLVNEARFSWSGAKSDSLQDPFGQLPPAAAQVKGVPIDATTAGGVTRISIDGYFSGTNIGSPDFLPKFQHTNQFEYLDTLSWLKGNHQFKFGVDIMTPMKNEYLDVPSTRGTMRFRGGFTNTSTNGMPAFLLGLVSDAALTNVFITNQEHWATMFFVQDDWKVSKKLSLNLGVRYDFMTPALEAQNRMANFVPGGAGSLVFAKDGSLEDRALVKPDKNNFAPRLGFVYKVDEQTLVRGGYGIFYNIFDRVGSEDQLSLNPPGLINNSLSNTTTPLFVLRDGFPSNFLDPNAPGLLSRVRVRAQNPDNPNTTIQQFSVGFQRQLGASLVVSVDGIGTKGSHLAELVNLNQPVGGRGPLPYPTFGFIEYRNSRASSDYKGVDVTVERRFSKGFGFGFAYTLGKSTDNSGEHLNTNASFPQDSRDINAWKGPSDYDVRHRFVGNFVAELPFGKGKKWATSGAGAAILGDWTLSGIYTVRTGLPFTVVQGSNNVGINMTGLPNRVGDGEGAKTVDSWYDVTAFAAVPSGTFGNSGRNILRGPGWQSGDLSLQRRLRLSGERVGATLRWDVFNVFNHTNLGLPDANISNTATRATITQLSGDPRIMQFALRLDF